MALVFDRGRCALVVSWAVALVRLGVGRRGVGAMISVLFARRDSIYKMFDGCDVWDAERDARNFAGRCPVVAHPPCRGWGRLKGFAKPQPGELELGLLAVDVVRKNGGVLEHPAGSSLWRAKDMPRPTMGIDEFGGYTIHVNQCDFGHRAQKATWLYIVGVTLADLPRPTITLGFPDRTVEQLGRAAREHTPRKMAEWLVEVARSTNRPAAPDLQTPAHLARSTLGPPGQVDPGQPAAPGQLSLNL